MKISIIIPTYNRASFIEKTIQSVLDQTYSDFECIIVDDGSTDNTEEVINKIKDPRLFYYKKDNGERGAARNFGIAKAIGDYVTFLDSDDILYPNHFEEAIKFIETKQPKVFHQGYEIKGADDKLIFRSRNQTKSLNALLLKGNLMSCMGVFVEKELLNEIKFSEEIKLSGSEDWLLWLRFGARYPIMYCNNITACMINHESRSVLLFDEISQLNRLNYLIAELKTDSIFMNRYGMYLNKIHASKLSYIALHAALAKQKKTALRYLIKAVVQNPMELLKRRMLAIIKKLIF